MSIIQKLSEGIINRDMKAEGQALLNKWKQTGLLEGLSGEQQRHTMARLLENQAKELLRESNTMQGGAVEGFAAVAFPIVRRVFAGLIANDLVSVQPMSLPSGLIFFLDFQFSDRHATRAGQAQESIYGQGVKGSEITGGVQLTSDVLNKQPYGFASSYSSATGSNTNVAGLSNYATLSKYADNSTPVAQLNGSELLSTILASADAEKFKKLVKYDVDFLAADTLYVAVKEFDLSAIQGNGNDFSEDMLQSITVASNDANDVQVRRLTQILNPAGTEKLVFIVTGTSDVSSSTLSTITWAATDNLRDAGPLGAIEGGANWPLENETGIPEIDIRVDSIAITAGTKKLKAKWTPELGQDLNAYHNLDAEVELTSILSEQIALEIDREILADLVNGATAATYYWSRSPGLFVNKETGAELGAASAAPDFTGTVSEWYETLIETINDVSAQIHRKTLRGGANFVVCSPEVANILEFTSGFRANVTADADKGDIGAIKAGSLSRKFDVMVDPYFPRNLILVGRKGSSFLESGYVYAPYVPLQTTPTIFGPEDFVPRKGVMTRYGKKMVRPDMYGLVVVRGLLGEEGSTGA